MMVEWRRLLPLCAFSFFFFFSGVEAQRVYRPYIPYPGDKGVYGREGRQTAGINSHHSDFAISYHGGRLLTRPIDVNIIFYGRGWKGWQRHLVKDFLASFTARAARGGVPDVRQWWKINREYTDWRGRNVSAEVRLKAVVRDVGSQGTDIKSMGRIRNVVKRALARKAIKKSPFSITLVLTSASTNVSGLCSQFCGYHDAFRYKGTLMVYGMAANAGILCPINCATHFMAPSLTGFPFTLGPPNGDIGIDAMLNVVGHELAESASNPVNTGWWDSKYTRYENADWCISEFGKFHRTKKRGKEIVFNHLGANGRYFLIQTNYALSKSACVDYV